MIQEQEIKDKILAEISTAIRDEDIEKVEVFSRAYAFLSGKIKNVSMYIDDIEEEIEKNGNESKWVEITPEQHKNETVVGGFVRKANNYGMYKFENGKIYKDTSRDLIYED